MLLEGALARPDPYSRGVPTLTTLLLFSGTAMVLLVIPGPAVLYIVTRGASQGHRAALVSMAGIHTGTLVHVLAAVVGLSAVIVASATAFTIIKLAGAAYLVWLGIQTLANRGSGERTDTDTELPRSTRRMYTDGVVVNILNPKTAVFFLAFVPQFVDTDTGNTTTQILVLSALFVALGIVSDGAYGLAAGWIGGHLRDSPTLNRRKDTVAGSIYLALGAGTALSN